MHPSVMRRSEAARELGISENTITLYLRRGWLAGIQVGRRWLVRRASVEHLLRYGVPLMLPDQHLQPANLLEYAMKPAEPGSSSSSEDHTRTYEPLSGYAASLARRVASWE